MTPCKASAQENLLLGFQAKKGNSDTTQPAVSTARGGSESLWRSGISASSQSSPVAVLGSRAALLPDQCPGFHVRDRGDCEFGVVKL